MLKSFFFLKNSFFLDYHIMDKDCVISATQSNSNHHVPTQTITKNNLAIEDILVHILPPGSED